MDRLIVFELHRRHVEPVVLTAGRARDRVRGHDRLIVPLTMTYDGASEIARLVREGEGPSLGAPSSLPGATSDDRSRLDDFAPPRDALFLHLYGHATSANVTTTIDAELDVAGRSLLVRVSASEPRRALPIAGAYRRGVATRGAAAHLSGDEEVTLTNLSLRGPVRRVRLPGRVPKAWALPPLGASLGRETRAMAIPLACTSLSVDVDRERLILGFVGDLPRGCERVAVVLAGAQTREEPTAIDLLRALATSRISLATEREDLAPVATPDPAVDAEREALLTLHRHACLEHVPEPTLPLDRYARISAELSEKREPRDVTLARHDLDETSFAAEELAWLDLVGKRALDGDLTLAESLGRFTLEAQDALGAPEEARRTLDDWVNVRADLLVAADPADALAAHGVTLPVWLRLDRRFVRACDDDPVLAREAERRIEAARIARIDREARGT